MELLYHVEITFLVYLTYAIIGWILEVTCKAIEYKKFVNRGFLIGPYCPIYGTGAILITLLLNRYIEDPFTLFIMAILICSLLEYITSYSMEKLFKARWWDYSRYRFNINGRICLETTIPFGILGLFIMYVANPFILNILLSIPSILLHTITGMLFLVFLVDNMISFKIMLGVRGTTNEFNQKVKDNTEEITRKVKEAITNKSFLNKRLIKAFPGFKSTREKIKNRREKKRGLKYMEEAKKEVFAKGFNLYKVFWIFMLGCFLGDIHEVVLHFLKYGEIVGRRGVIYGPFNPVYGFGATLFFILMYKMKKPQEIFLIGGLIGGGFEFLCSFIQEKVFGTISWDYSNYFLNINGRTSLFHAVCWGVMALIFVKYAMPLAEKSIEKMPIRFGKIISWILMIFMVLNMLISAMAARRQLERHEGVEARNTFERFLDRTYHDERLKEVYQNTMEIQK